MSYYKKLLEQEYPKLMGKIVDDLPVGDIDRLFTETKTQGKYLILCSQPHIWGSDQVKNSYFIRHIYKIYYLKPSTDDISELVYRLKSKINKQQVQTVKLWTDGIVRLAKYLILNSHLLKMPLAQAAGDNELKLICEDLVQETIKTPVDVLEKVGIVENGKVRAELLRVMVAGYKPGLQMGQIVVEADLRVTEDGQTGTETLTREEVKIIRFLCEGKGIISREEIANIKWGETAGYDRFSDQAINKQINRLNKKLKFYQLKAVRGMGYKLGRRIS